MGGGGSNLRKTLIGSDSGLVQRSIKQLTEPVLPQVYADIWRHQATVSWTDNTDSFSW